MLFNKIALLIIFLKSYQKSPEFESFITISNIFKQDMLSVFFEDVLNGNERIESDDFLLEGRPELFSTSWNISNLFFVESSEEVKMLC